MKSSVSKATVELCWAKKKNKKFGVKQLVKLLKWQLDPHNNYSITIINIYQIKGYQFSRVLIGSRNSEYPWIFTVLRTARKMARRFAKVLEEEIEEVFFYPSDLVKTKTAIPLRVGEEQWIYTI